MSYNNKTINTDLLHSLMNSLSEHFYTVSDLISKQIKAVVGNNFDELNLLIEKQIEVNGTIADLESNFKKSIIHQFSLLEHKPTTYSLTELLPHLGNTNTDKLAEERDQLKEAIRITQRKQAHLVQLLDFAQQHLAETLREIFNLSEQHSTLYKSSGQKTTGHNHSRMINQTI